MNLMKLKTKGPWTLCDDLSLTHFHKLESALSSYVHNSGAPSTKKAPGFHLIYFNHSVSESELGVDGYDDLQAPGIQLNPNEVLVRRWVGGSIRFGDLKLGKPAICTESLNSVNCTRRNCEVVIDRLMKNVDSKHWQIHETRRLLYFPGTPRTLQLASKIKSPVVPGPAFKELKLNASPALLFRYSALTFNAHRIHFDLNYATEVERLPGLVVQGQLLITLLLWWLAKFMDIRKIDYQNISPVYANEEIRLQLVSDCKAQIVNRANEVVLVCSLG